MKADKHNGVQNSNKVNEYLKSEFAEEYYNLYTILHTRVEDEEALDDVMQDILGLLYNAQKENRIPESIYGDTRDDFCNRVLQVLLQKVEEKKQIKRANQKTITFYRVIIGLICCGFAGFILVNKLWNDGTIGSFKDGFQYFMENRNYIMAYKNIPTYPEVEVDLYNLDSNKGKLIYDDGKSIISIESMEQDAFGIYHVTFRARGNYNKSGGSLITPIFKNSLKTKFESYSIYEHTDSDGITYRVTAPSYSAEIEAFDEVMLGKLQVLMDGSPYACKNGQMDAFKYKDGDVFEFQLFTNEYYGENGFLLQDELNQQNGKVILRLYDLVKATWERVDSNRLK